MKEREATEKFITRWMNNPDFPKWLPKVEFDKQSDGVKREYYEKGHNQVRSLMWEQFQDPKIGAQAREQMCWIMAVGLWEKQRRIDQKPQIDTEAWGRHAAQRVRDRTAGRIGSMPLTNKDGQVYLGLIEREVRRSRDEN